MTDATTGAQSEAPRHRVLLVEDDEDVVALLREILSHEGFEPVVARDGLEGLLRMQTGTPDLALLDIMMPDVNGVRVVEQLLEDGDGSLPVPIIVITGSPDGAAQARELLGREDVFEKPFDPTKLIARIRERLGPSPSSPPRPAPTPDD
ncbi:MAG: response regulator transcription factor [Actinomycetes bacterium]